MIVEGCGLPAMPTRLRTVEDEVNTTASNLPRLDRVAGRRRRRRGPHGAVGRDVVELPAEVDQAGHEGLGGDVGARQEDPVDRVEHVVVRRPVVQQAGGGLLAGRHQVGAQAPGGDRRGGLVADGGDLEAGEGAGVEAVLLELLAHRLDRVDRGEGDPLVAALDQAADGLVHLQRVARRLDRDGRHLLGHRAVAAQPRRDSEPACSLVRGTSTRQPNSGLVSNHDSVSRRSTTSPTTVTAGGGDPGGAGVGGDVGRASRRPSPARWWCRPGSSRPGSRRAAGGDQRGGDLADRADARRAAPGCGRRRTGSSRPWRRR